MNERPPNEDDDVDERYRRASARDASRPSESVRRAILRQAAELGARAQPGRSRSGRSRSELPRAGPTVEAGPVKLDFKQPAANEARWRPAAYGGLAAAALAGLLIAPHFLPSSSLPDSSSPRAIASASKKPRLPRRPRSRHLRLPLLKRRRRLPLRRYRHRGCPPPRCERAPYRPTRAALRADVPAERRAPRARRPMPRRPVPRAP